MKRRSLLPILMLIGVFWGAAAPANLAAEDAARIQLSAQPDNRLISPDTGQMHLLVRLKANRADVEADRRSLNIALVIDRSGSMAGQKIIDARSAAIGMLGQMRDGDRVTVVSYSDDVSVDVAPTILEEASRRKIQNIIHGISDSGSTNLGGGLVSGIQNVTSNAATSQVNRVLLISDGLANKGITDPAHLDRIAREALQKGVIVSTLGLGVDYNEDLMTSIADNGGGNYYFVENSADIESTLNQEVRQMASTVGKNVQLRLTLPDGASVDEVYGWISRTADQRVTVELGELFSGQNRSILCKLKFVPLKEVGNELKIAPVELLYDAFAGEKSVPTTVETEPLVLTVSDDKSVVLAARDMEVAARIVEIELATQLEDAARLIGQHDFDGAKKVLAEAVEDARKSSELVPEEFRKELDTAIVDAQEMSSGIEQARTDAQARKSLTKGGKSKSYSKKKGSR